MMVVAVVLIALRRLKNPANISTDVYAPKTNLFEATEPSSCSLENVLIGFDKGSSLFGFSIGSPPTYETYGRILVYYITR